MSPIGRIFVVVNLVLAAAFLGFASANLANAHKWRSMADTTQTELASTKKQLQEEIAKLSAERDAAKGLQSAAIEEKKSLTAAKEGLVQDLARLRDEKSALDERVGSIASTLENYDQRSTQLAQDLKAATDDRVSANNEKRDAMTEREAALQAKRDAEAAKAAAERKITDLEKSLAMATENIGRQDTLIAAYAEVSGLTLEQVGGQIPTIQGAVVGVMEQGGQSLVHLNVGRNEGLKRGFMMYIYSSGQLKGRARVEVVNDATATAVLLDPVEGRKVAQGDRATTRIL